MSPGSVETVTEKVSLLSNGTQRSFTVGRNVVLHAAEDEKRDRDSDKSHSKVLCEYKWDPKTVYDGRILSARQRLVAYRLFNEQTGEAIRVMERESRARHLIKDFKQPIVDIQFADEGGQLAVLDKNANLYIYHVSEDGSELTKHLNIIRPNNYEARNPKLVWCPFMEDESANTSILAVYYDRTVEIFFLHTIKNDFNVLEVQLSEFSVNSEHFVQIQTETDISAVKISPDATACAVTTVSGEFIFYILENFQGREAHNLHPLKNLYVNDMLFLDNLNKTEDNCDGPYWKYVVLISDNGRRLGIYSCYNWECVGKLRFESGTSKLDAILDKTARFVYLADYENSNLFVLELAPAFPGIQPYFVACSQISFHQQLICVAPCSLEDDINTDTDDLLLDDESFKASKVCVTFAAITNRSLVEIKVEVEKALDIALDEDPETGAKIIGEKLAEQTKQLMISSQRLRTSSAASNEIRSPKDDMLPSFNSSSSTDPSVHTELRQLRKLLQNITEKSTATEKRLNEMNIQLEKIHKDNTDLRREQTDNLADVLEKISNEMRNRDEHIEQTVKRMNTDLRVDVQRIVEQTLNDNAVSLQSTMEMSNSRVVETVKSVLSQLLVPAVEQICNQLLHQLNEKFRDGLQEFIEQMKVTQSHCPTPMIPDYNVLTRMIEQNQVIKAFEFVTQHNDYTGIIFLCNKLNPETVFNDSKLIFPHNVLLSLVQHLGQRFEEDTELKLNYLENIALSLERNPIAHFDTFKLTLEQCSADLLEFVSKEKYQKYKRQGRVISQLIVYAMKK
ncbi:unnamed protein product [Bursaphelenchus okinawaensis]|uniref:Enhancer of mRNA-decapping protein 4 WD40 repeat region domain-containing protein n=1 Tax=Bursaphelenchus okinawaensis TaxID=465554 RepID=A0A811JQB4_9BILA|nr:unnamed protein product [Bursaphelenchus okinawaensis]CAG9078020.1 unnamed protein product [Bursaphelenchus okinawaensis]